MENEIEIEIPDYIELKQSTYKKNDLGAFSSLKLESNQFLGSFKPNSKISFNCTLTVSNWLKFIRFTNDLNKYNITCSQENEIIKFYTFKEIKPGDELVYYFSEGLDQNEESKDSFNSLWKSDDDLKQNKQKSIKTKTQLKVWTCQMCKKKFEQRIFLNRHECIENSLKLYKKRKEIRKKKLKDLQWKRKIDLSYIETTCLTHLSKNIADNLSFCIDGTSQDLKSYSKEVKDYLNSMIGKESYNQMMIRCCYPELK